MLHILVRTMKFSEKEALADVPQHVFSESLDVDAIDISPTANDDSTATAMFVEVVDSSYKYNFNL